MENKINKMKEKTKEFWENNKDIIKEGVAWCLFAGVTFTIGYLAGGSNEKSKIIEKQSKTIQELENICKKQEASYCKSISDGLRHGSSYAGKQMNYRKQHISKVA